MNEQVESQAKGNQSLEQSLAPDHGLIEVAVVVPISDYRNTTLWYPSVVHRSSDLIHQLSSICSMKDAVVIFSSHTLTTVQVVLDVFRHSSPSVRSMP